MPVEFPADVLLSAVDVALADTAAVLSDAVSDVEMESDAESLSTAEFDVVSVVPVDEDAPDPPQAAMDDAIARASSVIIIFFFIFFTSLFHIVDSS